KAYLSSCLGVPTWPEWMYVDTTVSDPPAGSSRSASTQRPELVGSPAPSPMRIALICHRDAIATPARPLNNLARRASSHCAASKKSAIISSGARTSCRSTTSGSRSASHSGMPLRHAARIPLTLMVAIFSTALSNHLVPTPQVADGASQRLAPRDRHFKPPSLPQSIGFGGGAGAGG